MKIGILKIKNRSKKKPQKLDVYIIHYLKGKPKKNRLKGMYLFQRPRTAFQKNHNKDTNYEIEQILSKARKEQRLGYYDIEDYTKEAISVISYCEEVFIPKKSTKISKQSIHPYIKVTQHFKEFFGHTKTFADVTESDAEDFKYYMKNSAINRYKRKYKVNTINTYLNRLVLIFTQAMKDGNLTNKRTNWIEEAGYFKEDKTKRPYISLKEYNSLDENMCLSKPIARAFKFSILTGLRTSDIMALRWKDIAKDVKGWFMYVNMKKGGKPIRVSLTEKHLKLLGERATENEVVFDYSMSSAEYTYFYVWIQNTFGNSKPIKEQNNGITFHTGRASFITNMLMEGIPAIRVKEYVGHEDLKTTLSYYRGSTEMQEEDMQRYMDALEGKRAVLSAQKLLS